MAELTLFGALRNALTPREKALNAIPQNNGWHRIFEPFTGAWQRNKEECRGDLLSYPTLFACITRIAGDIAKLPFMLKSKEDGIWSELENPAFSPVLRKPNSYQTAQQFRESWVLSRLIQGNSYILKQRDNRNIVTRLYVLDPYRVRPLVSDSGEIFYELMSSGWCNLPPIPAGYPADHGNVIVPAAEIIHDRANTFHHQLIGVPPLCAANWPAVKNMRILRNASQFFENGAQPGGILTAPAGMSDENAKEVKEYWDQNFQGQNSGKVAVIGADMKFTSFAFKAADSQLVEQMQYSDKQICQPFGLKPYKLGLESPPANWKADDVNIEYFGDALSPIIEAMENLLTEGLNVSRPMRVEIDTDPLWRMDEGKKADVANTLVGGKISTPNEARQRFNLPSTGGGDTLWGQNQDYPLGMLSNRAEWDPAMVGTEPPPEDEERQLLSLIEKQLDNEPDEWADDARMLNAIDSLAA